LLLDATLDWWASFSVMMIDLHCHILPGVDDGAADLSVSLAMAEAYIAEGVTVVACTPHIFPGLYDNRGPQIRAAVAALQSEFDRRGIALQLVCGADIHVAPGLVDGLRSGELLTLADSRYVLLELPHHVAPPRLENIFVDLVTAGYVPILTHPERLTWLPAQYELVSRLVSAGTWMQVTAGALAGNFGFQARELAERMLDEGLVHILASDAHNADRRPPDLKRGYELAAARIGEQHALDMVYTRPRGVLDNVLADGLANLSIAGQSMIAHGLRPSVAESRGNASQFSGSHDIEGSSAPDRRRAGRLRRLIE
jgi:protein-tyrosine phosphatase